MTNNYIKIVGRRPSSGSEAEKEGILDIVFFDDATHEETYDAARRARELRMAMAQLPLPPRHLRSIAFRFAVGMTGDVDAYTGRSADGSF